MRAFLLVIDSFGLGATPDAAEYDDTGADTFGHIAQWCARGEVNENRAKAGPLTLPNMARLGLGKAAELVTGSIPAGLEATTDFSGRYGACAELSKGKDTPSGHWEMAGFPVLYDWGYFPPEHPSFPEALLSKLISEGVLPGVLGNCHASGTVILDDLGDEHIKTGKPIVYTSSDSVFQIAAHEKYFGLDRLYHICDIARGLVDDYNIGRVIARPFVGEDGTYERTANRRDYATPPQGETLLDVLDKAGHDVISVGKIADIFAHRGISHKFKASGTEGLFQETMKQVKDAADGSLTFTNFVNFDQDFGHRRNVGGYANELEVFDALLPKLQSALKSGDLVILTADHGCDPTWPGTDHTREYVPFIAFGPDVGSGSIGLRESFADIGQTIASHLGVKALKAGHAAF